MTEELPAPAGLSASERFREIFEEIITTQPNTINQEQIDQLVELIINEDSGLYALTDQYIQGEQTRIDPQGRIALITTPEFIQRIWGQISRTLILKLNEDIRTIRLTLPDNYAELDARGKCSHVRPIFAKLDDIHGNLFPGVVSFILHTLQGLFGFFKDEVNRNQITAQAVEIEQLNTRTSKIIESLDDRIKKFTRYFVYLNSIRRRNILPEMCSYKSNCKNIDTTPHKLQFIHKLPLTSGKYDVCWFESLVEEKPLRTNPLAHDGGRRPKSNKQTIRKSQSRRRRRRSSKQSTRYRTRRRR